MAADSTAGESPGSCRDAAPPHGLSVPCHVRATVSLDHLIVDLTGGVEIELFLLGLHAVPNRERTESGFRLSESAIYGREWVAERIAAAGDRGTVFIPLPEYDRGWIRNLRPGTRHAGVLFVGQDRGTNLNAAIAAASLCPVDPRCPYLSLDSKGCHADALPPMTRRVA